jgi:hypothetical protein
VGKNESGFGLRAENVKDIGDATPIFASLEVLDESEKHRVENAPRTVLLGPEVGLTQEGEGPVSLQVEE